VHTDLKGKRLFALKVKNDCMEPEFKHGDIIIVDPDVSWENGDYVVARLNHDDEATFKQLKIYKTRIVLHPLNYPVFDDIKYPKKEFDKHVTIIGKVVEKKKRY
ncbi:MAG: LexA family protein, partial [Methylococcales bacterium]